MLRAWRLFRRINSHWRMRVDEPTAVGNRIVKRRRVQNVALRHHVLADKPAALAFSGQEAEPLERPVIGAVAAAILDVVPNAQHDREQLVSDLLVRLDRIEVSAPLDPPITVFETKITKAGRCAVRTQAQIVFGELAG